MPETNEKFEEDPLELAIRSLDSDAGRLNAVRLLLSDREPFDRISKIRLEQQSSDSYGDEPSPENEDLERLLVLQLVVARYIEDHDKVAKSLGISSGDGWRDVGIVVGSAERLLRAYETLGKVISPKT